MKKKKLVKTLQAIPDLDGNRYYSHKENYILFVARELMLDEGIGRKKAIKKGIKAWKRRSETY